ncbi:MAG: hypothetical protein GKR89_20820 [Candidatus Latescibacteria bacterium]|nr:hypothetical protein [Candidatus Latescibacterota bacterium]
MRRPIRILAIGGALAVLVVVGLSITPLGPWGLARLLAGVGSAYGWRLQIAETGGVLVGTIALDGVQAESEAGDITVSLSQLELSLWDYAVRLRDPQVQVVMASAADTAVAAADTGFAALPIDYIPELVLEGGALELVWPEDSLRVHLAGLEAAYQPVAAGGRLSWTGTAWQVVAADGSPVAGDWSGQAVIAADMIEVEQLTFAAQMDSLDLDASGRAELGWRQGLPIRASLEVGLQAADSLVAQVQVGASGKLQPMDLRATLQGRADGLAVGAVQVAGEISLDSTAVVLDSLEVVGLGGAIVVEGAYHWTPQRLQANWAIDAVELGQLHESVAAGRLGGRGQVDLDWPGQRLAADADLVVQALDALPGGPIDAQLTLSHRLDGDTQIVLQSDRGHLSAQGSSALDGTYELGLEGELDVGQIGGKIQVQGRAVPDELVLQLTARKLALGAGGVGPVKAELAIRQQRFLAIDLGMEDGLAGLQLALDLADQDLDSLAGFVHLLALDRFAPSLAGTVQGTAHAQGGLDLQQLVGRGRFAISDLVYQGWSAGPLDISLEYGEGAALGRLAGRGVIIDLALDAQSAEFDIRAQLEKAQVYQLDTASTDTAVVMELSGRIEAHGALPRLEDIALTVELDDLKAQLDGVEMETLRPLRVRYADQSLDLDTLALQTSAGLVQALGQTRGDSLDLQFGVEDLNLVHWVPAWKGNGFVQGRLGGTVQAPQLAMQLQANNLMLGEQILGDVVGSVDLADSLIVAAQLRQGEGRDGLLRLRAGLPAQTLWRDLDSSAVEAVEVELKAQRLDLAGLLSFALDDSVSGFLGLSGRFSVPVSLMASPLRWRHMRGGIVLDELELEKEGIQLSLPQAAKLQLQEDHIELSDMEMVLQAYNRRTEQWQPAGAVRLAGNIESQRPSHFELSLQQFDLLVLDILQLASMPPGLLDLSLDLQGTAAQPRLQATLDMAMEDYGQVSGRLLASDIQGDAELTWKTPLGDEVLVQGLVPWDWEQRLVDWDQGHLQARSDGLGLLLFLEQLPELEDLDGRVRMDLQVQGLGDSARVQGQIAVENLAVELLDTKPRYVFPGGRLEFDGRRGVLHDFVGGAQKGGGRIELAGFVEMESLADWDYQIKVLAKNLPYRYEEIFTTSGIDIDLALRRTALGPLVQGRVLLDGSQVEPPLIDLSAPPVPPPPPAVQDPLLERTRLDVSVEVRKMQIKNELADLMMAGGVTVYGTFYKPRFQGGLEVAEGKVFIFNQEFEFNKGIIGLDRLQPTYSVLDLAYDPLLLDPSLDLEAEAQVFDTYIQEKRAVVFRLRGTALRPEPVFTAEGLGDMEIFSLLALGSSDSGEGLDGQGLYAAAGQLLLGRQFKRIGLDEFQVLPLSNSALGPAGSLGIRMGKFFKFPLPLWVRYEASTETPSEGEFRVKYNLNTYIVITGTAQSEYGRYGLGLGFDKDF